MKIIGLSGTNGSGKDTIANLLVASHAFYFASATEMLSAELDARGLPHEREYKRQLSAEWREKYGLGVIVDKAVELAKTAGSDYVVVGSLRNPGEADRIHELGGIVVWVDADPKIRYDRIQMNNRGRVEDNKTYEQFISEEQAEMYSPDPTKLSMSEVKKRADIFIENNGESIDAFKEAAAKQLAAYL